jgi:ClpX C4-type zinc finger
MAGHGDDVENARDDDDRDDAVVAAPGVVLRAGTGALPPVGVFGFGFGGGGARRCSFCSRREAAVAKLVQSRGAYICDRCVDLAANAIDEDSTERVIRIRPRSRLTIDRDDAEEEIERAFETVFAAPVSDQDRCNAIESGDDLLPTMAEVRVRFPARDQVDIAVNAIRFLDDTEAEVGYALILPGQAHPGMQMPQGYAVQHNGRWKVARETYAAAVARIGVQLPPIGN